MPPVVPRSSVIPFLPVVRTLPIRRILTSPPLHIARGTRRTIYLIVSSIIPGGPDTTIPLILLAIILGLPGLLIVITSHKVAYVGWMPSQFPQLEKLEDCLNTSSVAVIEALVRQ